MSKKSRKNKRSKGRDTHTGRSEQERLRYLRGINLDSVEETYDYLPESADTGQSVSEEDSPPGARESNKREKPVAKRLRQWVSRNIGFLEVILIPCVILLVALFVRINLVEDAVSDLEVDFKNSERVISERFIEFGIFEKEVLEGINRIKGYLGLD